MAGTATAAEMAAGAAAEEEKEEGVEAAERVRVAKAVGAVGGVARRGALGVSPGTTKPEHARRAGGEPKGEPMTIGP